MSQVPEETKGLYPSVPPDQQQQPGGYYLQQQEPVGPTAPPGQTVVTYYPPAEPPQQQSQQLVIAPGAPVIVEQAQPRQSFIVHIIFSCFVTWCCACPCGLTAFILAMVALSRSAGLPDSARQLGIASIVLSIVGVVTGIIATIIYVIYLAFFGHIKY